jgi:hypothetical protein
VKKEKENDWHIVECTWNLDGGSSVSLQLFIVLGVIHFANLISGSRGRVSAL